MTGSIERHLPDPSATEALGRALAGLARAGDVIALWGDLGTGKTVFARAFIRALSDPEEEVPSPTFTLVQTYDFAEGTIYHFDAYRLEKPEEAFELGIEDAFCDGISLIEWPGRLGSLLPFERLDIELIHVEETQSRRAVLSGPPQWLGRLKEADGV
ncbi:MAG: tRNA (adenosine(37)-N6)-threonylcarbamoyltransferase complex ATPase subunit type 1 TsaE [Rhodospirillales bacterium]|jgi:tRNA threonylcarbamoyladenosine biosynthesis protein TsaE|nr:tRNA (adenosine(37)-N6)-threonylcarbamoyltransferase complex ATPase subunit type 1 TsaE [Rhodospirillales bacterium]